MSKKKILIVEDDLDQVKALTTMLRASSYDTFFALDGISAVQIAHRERPDLIIMDIGLPGGDGFLVKERLNMSQELSSIPIIVITGLDPTLSFERSLKTDVAAFFHKPFDIDQFLSAVNSELQASADAA
jgi:DNA-binding response OmpR family regulator